MVIARLKIGVTITVATLGSIGLLFFCALLIYRQRLKRQQTVYPSSRDAADECWNAEDSETEEESEHGD